MAIAETVAEILTFDEAIKTLGKTVSGAHLLACASFLRLRGAEIQLALCLARTVNTQHPTPLQLPAEDLEAAPFLGTLFNS